MDVVVDTLEHLEDLDFQLPVLEPLFHQFRIPHLVDRPQNIVIESLSQATTLPDAHPKSPPSDAKVADVNTVSNIEQYCTISGSISEKDPWGRAFTHERIRTVRSELIASTPCLCLHHLCSSIQNQAPSWDTLRGIYTPSVEEPKFLSNCAMTTFAAAQQMYDSLQYRSTMP